MGMVGTFDSTTKDGVKAYVHFFPHTASGKVKLVTWDQTQLKHDYDLEMASHGA